MLRLQLIFLFYDIFGFTLLNCYAGQMRGKPPHIIVILADDMVCSVQFYKSGAQISGEFFFQIFPFHKLIYDIWCFWQGWNDLSCHNSNLFLTPNIDSIVFNGISLYQFHSASLCTPSRSALMTGRFPINIGKYWSHIKHIFAGKFSMRANLLDYCAHFESHLSPFLKIFWFCLWQRPMHWK